MADTHSTSTNDVIDAVLDDHIHFRALFMQLDTANGEAREEVWQQIDDATLLQVDEDGAVTPAPPEGEVVNAQHARRRGVGLSGRPHPPQQCIGARGDRQPPSRAGAGLAAEQQPDEPQGVVEAHGLATVRSHHTREAFAEDTLCAEAITTAEAAGT